VRGHSAPGTPAPCSKGEPLAIFQVINRTIHQRVKNELDGLVLKADHSSRLARELDA